ncbi:MmgE/PrpD family protein [Jiangella muralis]|uniref:MmgE/PrpD family protein n=1 Tax=Jiangella muralis TaxID=702383 RepID=UPI00069FD29B|nr:MmgE/PrpD family protein [Jiangella muralis]
MTTVKDAAEWAQVAYAGPVPKQVYESTRKVLLNDLTMAQLADGELWRQVRSAVTRSTDGVHLRALLGGMRIHALAMDSNDEPSQAHLGAAVIPTLAVAPPTVTGADFLRAVAIGWQVGSSIGARHLPRILARGARPSVLFGAIGATVSAGLLRSMPSHQLAESVRLVADIAAGASATLVEGSDDWLVQLGRASHAGLLASNLAAAGLRGAQAPLEDDVASSPGPALPAAGPGASSERWAIDLASYKRYPACNILQTAVALACRARADLDTAAEDIDHVVVWLNDADIAYPGITNPAADRPVAAMMSGTFCVAAALIHGTLTHDQVLAPGSDPRVVDLARRVRLHGDPGVEPASARLDVHVRGAAPARVLTPDAVPSTVSLTALRLQLDSLLPDDPSARRRHAALAADIAGLEHAPSVPNSLRDALWGDPDKDPLVRVARGH